MEEPHYSHLNEIFDLHQLSISKILLGTYATNVFIKINMPSAESIFSEMELNLLK